MTLGFEHLKVIFRISLMINVTSTLLSILFSFPVNKIAIALSLFVNTTENNATILHYYKLLIFE